MKLWRLMLLLVLAGCHKAPAPKAAPVVNTMPNPVQELSVARSVVEPPSAWRVRWDYPYNATVAFEVWSSESLLDWTIATNTLIMEVAFPNKKSEFFKVRAVDLISGEHSDWGTTH